MAVERQGLERVLCLVQALKHEQGIHPRQARLAAENAVRIAGKIGIQRRERRARIAIPAQQPDGLVERPNLVRKSGSWRFRAGDRSRSTRSVRLASRPRVFGSRHGWGRTWRRGHGFIGFRRFRRCHVGDGCWCRRRHLGGCRGRCARSGAGSGAGESAGRMRSSQPTRRAAKTVATPTTRNRVVKARRGTSDERDRRRDRCPMRAKSSSSGSPGTSAPRISARHDPRRPRRRGAGRANAESDLLYADSWLFPRFQGAHALDEFAPGAAQANPHRADARVGDGGDLFAESPSISNRMKVVRCTSSSSSSSR